MVKLIVYFIITVSLFAKKPLLMELVSIENNANLIFQYKKDYYICQPYGVIPLDTIYFDPKNNQICKKALAEFIQSNPSLLQYAIYHLKVRQFYHIMFKNGKCILYTKGKKIYSKDLLQNGLAIVDPQLKDKVYEFLLKKAQQSAIDAKRGLWQNYKVKTCVGRLLGK